MLYYCNLESNFKILSFLIILFKNLRIESSDLLIVVIDVNKYFNQINTGIDIFIKNHIKFILDNQLNNHTDDYDKLLQHKKIIITLNKKDLLNKMQLKVLDDLLEFYGDKTFSISKIECGNAQSDLSNLLNDMKKSLSKL